MCDDLIFFSCIAEAARAVGLSVRQVRTQAELVAAAGKHAPGGVILDLHNPGLDLPSLLVELHAACPAMPRVIAYGSHVEAEVLRAAREAGCDRVLPRSKFVKEVNGAIAEWLSPPVHPAESDQKKSDNVP